MVTIFQSRPPKQTAVTRRFELLALPSALSYAVWHGRCLSNPRSSLEEAENLCPNTLLTTLFLPFHSFLLLKRLKGELPH